MAALLPPEADLWPQEPWVWIPHTQPPRRVVVPFAPPSLNDILSRRWGSVHVVKRAWLDLMDRAVARARRVGIWDGTPWPPGSLQITVGIAHRQRQRDLDNLVLKWAIDGLRAGGVLHDDNPTWVQALHVRAVRTTGRRGFTVLEWCPPEAGAEA